MLRWASNKTNSDRELGVLHGSERTPGLDHRPSVLVVDDELSILKWLGKALQEGGYEVLEAANAPTALGILGGSSIDALILDVRLVGHSGLDVLEHVRSKKVLEHLPVIILTGILHLSEREEESIRRHRAYVFYKPAGLEEILALLAHLLQGKEPTLPPGMNHARRSEE